MSLVWLARMQTGANSSCNMSRLQGLRLTLQSPATPNWFLCLQAGHGRAWQGMAGHGRGWQDQFRSDSSIKSPGKKRPAESSKARYLGADGS